MTTYHPTQDRIIICRDPADEVTEGGIIKPGVSLDDQRFATVVSTGPDVKGTFNKGDRIMTALSCGQPLSAKDPLTQVILEKQVICKVEENAPV